MGDTPGVAARWTSDQVLSIAPDPASAKAGLGLASTANWTQTGEREGYLWGLCRGSGKTPYQTVVEVAGPAFSCSCPSRKFPCKHALALLLLWSRGELAPAAPADFAEAWRAARTARANLAEQPPRAKAAADPAQARKRAEQRLGRVADGLADLDRWLGDQVRIGLAGNASKGYGHFEQIAARMVDAQAPAVAGVLRGLAGAAGSGDGASSRLLEEYALLHLLVRGYRRRDEVPADLRDVINEHIGFTVPMDQVLESPPERDHWQIIGTRDTTDSKLSTRRTWLHGRASGRRALLLSFAAGGQSLDAAPPPGLAIEADLHLYPGRLGLRAVLGARHGEPTAAPTPDASGGRRAAESFAAALAADPWLTAWPVSVVGTPAVDDAGWWLVDPDGEAVVLRSTGVDPWVLMAVSAGAPLVVSGEWGPRGLLPLTAWTAQGPVSL